MSMCVSYFLPFLQRRWRARGAGITYPECVHRVLVALGTLRTISAFAETCSSISRTRPAHKPLCGALALARVTEAVPGRPVLALTAGAGHLD